MVDVAGPGSIATQGIGGAGPDLLAAMRATLSGNALLSRGTIVLPQILCRADALPQTDQPIVTGMAAIPADPDAPDPAPPGAPGGDGTPGGPGFIFFDGDQLCMVQADGTIKCTTLLEPKPETQTEIGIGVFFDGGGSAITNDTDVYHDVPFDCVIRGVKLLSDDDTTPEDLAVEFYRAAEGSWPPVLGTQQDRLGLVLLDNAREITDRTLQYFASTTLAKGDGLVFRFHIQTSSVTKLKATLLVEKV